MVTAAGAHQDVGDAAAELVKRAVLTAERHPATFEVVWRNREHVGDVLARAGREVHVDARAGVARARRVAPRTAGHPPPSPRRRDGTPFDRLRCQLLLLLAAELLDNDEPVTLSEVAEAVAGDAQGRQVGFDTLDPDHRRALVDAATHLASTGCLRVWDGDPTGFTTAEGDALIAGDRAALLWVFDPPPAAGPVDDPLLARLVDTPFVHRSDLPVRLQPRFDAVVSGSDTSAHDLADLLGVDLEVRRDTLALIDSRGALGKAALLRGDGTLDHALLMVARRLTPGTCVPSARVQAHVDDLAGSPSAGRWRRDLRDAAAGRHRLARMVWRRLVDYRLAEEGACEARGCLHPTAAVRRFTKEGARD